MKFIIKFFPEITIKSKPVRKLFVKQLRDNLRRQFKTIGSDIEVVGEWDKIVVHCADKTQHQSIVDILSCTSGIAYFLDVEQYPLLDLHDVYLKTQELWKDRLVGKRFVVRCKRAGKHDFTSIDIERYIGGGLNQAIEGARVDLHNPELTVMLEVRNDQLFIVNRRYEGVGGFPLGSLDPVLSLISGGFDSTVASYMTMRRGMPTHFCFFNLGGREHEIGVKEVAVYLWLKYGAARRVKFVAVPFEPVVAEILEHVNDSHMGVVLKRMMLRASSQIARQLNVNALVTGESVAQVSSQTLTNLSVIDEVTNTLVLRPLITTDKGDIIRTAREIGTEEFAASMPEYCGVISVKPTTRAKLDRVVNEEGKFDMAVLDRAIEQASFINIDEVANDSGEAADVEILAAPIPNAVILDVRHPTEEERKPLTVAGTAVVKLPFYQLHSRFAELDKNKIYLLYCEKGVMSRLHASHLVEQGYSNIKVYRP